MKLLQDKRDFSTWMLHAKSAKGAILQSYLNEDERRVEPLSASSNYLIVRELKFFKYGDKVLVSNDTINRYPKEFVIYLPERDRFLCREEGSSIYFQRRYCKGITTNDEELMSKPSKKLEVTE